MGIFDREILLFRDIHASIHETLMDTIKKNEKILLDYNREYQLNEVGQKSDGNEVGKYSVSWARTRIKFGKQIDHVDLNFTGNLQANLEIVVENDQFRIVSDVSYTDDLIRRYGTKILGIQQQFLEEFVSKYLIDELKKMIHDKCTGFKG